MGNEDLNRLRRGNKPTDGISTRRRRRLIIISAPLIISREFLLPGQVGLQGGPNKNQTKHRSDWLMGNQVKSYENDLYIWCPCIFDVFSWSWALHWNNLEGFDDGYCMGAIRTYINISPPISVEFIPDEMQSIADHLSPLLFRGTLSISHVLIYSFKWDMGGERWDMTKEFSVNPWPWSPACNRIKNRGGPTQKSQGDRLISILHIAV